MVQCQQERSRERESFLMDIITTDPMAGFVTITIDILHLLASVVNDRRCIPHAFVRLRSCLHVLMGMKGG